MLKEGKAEWFLSGGGKFSVPGNICIKDLLPCLQTDTKDNPYEMGADTRISCLTDNASQRKVLMLMEQLLSPPVSQDRLGNKPFSHVPVENILHDFHFLNIRVPMMFC